MKSLSRVALRSVKPLFVYPACPASSLFTRVYSKSPLSLCAIHKRTMEAGSNGVQEIKTGKKPSLIVTHDGTFHADEVLACYMLRHHTTQYRNASISRTRDPSLIAEADIVVDVGAEYNPQGSRYDHHQRGFTTTFAEDGRRSSTKLSSAGLVYKHFGEEIVGHILEQNGIQTASDELKLLYLKIYDCFMEAIDAIDNGVSMYDCATPPRYESATDLSSRVARLNADWFEKNPDQDTNFNKAMTLAGNEFEDCVKYVARSWLPARSFVKTAYDARWDTDPSGKIMVLREFAPWKDHLYTLEDEHKSDTDQECDEAKDDSRILYVIYEDSTGRSWRVQCVPVSKGSFQSRKPLPEPWRGLRDESLSDTIDIPGCVFVHASGFIGGHKSFDGAMEMAKKALTL